jgi:hypothetical protein
VASLRDNLRRFDSVQLGAYVEQEIIVPVNPGRLTFRTWGDLEPVKGECQHR